jgi:hypothetical protein
MKIKFFLLFFFLTPPLLHAQAPNWLWEKRAGGFSIERILNSTTDVFGNILVTGQFSSSAIILGSTTLTNAGNYDFFVAKYDAAGNVLWAKSAGGADADIGSGISLDANGNVFVTGTFSSATITFGSTVLTNASANQDIFIVKYDASGNVLWAKSVGGNNNEVGNAVSADVSGNVLVTGKYTSSPLTIGSITMGNSGSGDILVIKYDASGNVLWVRRAGGYGNEWANDVSTDVNGNVSITGAYESSTISFGSTTLTNTGTQSIFIAKYDSSGNALWAKGAGGGIIDFGTRLCTDVNGNVLVTGVFYSPSISFDSTVLTNAGYGDLFVTKYDTSGNLVWATRAGGTNADMGYGICTDASGNVFVTGVFYSQVINFGTIALTGPGQNIFVAGYNSSGNALWAKGSGGTNSFSESHGISVVNENIVIAGSYTNIVTFDSDTLFSAGSEDIVIAKLSSPTGIAEGNNYSPITIFPNPFSSVATIQSDRALENATFVMYNSMGQKVNEIVSITIDAGGTIELQRDGLSAGVYFIRVMEGDKIVGVEKLVVGDW